MSRDREGGERSAGAGFVAARRELPALSPDQEAEERAYGERLQAEQLAQQVAELAGGARSEWAERRAALEERVTGLQQRLRSPAGATTAAADRDRERAAASVAEARALLAHAVPPRAVPAVTGEEAMEAGVASKSADPDDVLLWVAGLSQAERRAVWSRYEKVTQGSREYGRAADGFAEALANYVAAWRIRGDLEALSMMTARQIALWRQGRPQQAVVENDPVSAVAAGQKPPRSAGHGRHAVRATAAPHADASAETHGPKSELADAAQTVIDASETVQLALRSQPMVDAELFRLGAALDALADHSHANARPAPEDERALTRALAAASGVADALASQHGPRGRAEVELRGHLAAVHHAAVSHGDAKPSDTGTDTGPDVRALLDGNLALLGRVRDVTVSSITVFPEVDLSELDAAIAKTRSWAETITSSDGTAARRLRPAITDQHEVLVIASRDLERVFTEPVGASSGAVVAAYVHAMARASERRELADAAVRRAQIMRRARALERATTDLENDDALVYQLHDLDPALGDSERRKHEAVAGRKARLDARIAEGEAVTGLESEEVTIQVREQALLHRMQLLETQAEQVARALDSLDDGWMGKLANGDVGVPRMLVLPAVTGLGPGGLDLTRHPFAEMLDDLRGLGRVAAAIRAGYRARIELAEDGLAPDTSHRRLLAQAKSAALDEMEDQVRDWLRSGHYDERLKHAMSMIDDAQTNLFLANLLVTVAMTLTGNAVAAGARGAVEGVWLARAARAARAAAAAGEVGELAAISTSAARTAGTVAGAVADGAVNVLGQKYVQHDDAPLWVLVAVNTLMPVVLGTVQKPLKALDELTATTEKNLSLWQRLKLDKTLALRRGGELFSEMVTGAAVDYTVRRAAAEPTADPSDQTAKSWLLQGAAMAFGRYASQHITPIRENLAKLEHGARDRAHHLAGHAAELTRLGREVEQTGDLHHANELMEGYKALLEAEHTFLEAEVDRTAPGDVDRLATLIKSNNRASRELARLGHEELAMRGGGLEPAAGADGATAWQGDASAVAETLRVARTLGIDTTLATFDPAARSWRVTLGERTFDVAEQRRTSRLPDSTPPRDHAELARNAKRASVARAHLDVIHAQIQVAVAQQPFLRSRHAQIGAGPQGAINQGVQAPELRPLDLADRVVIADPTQPSTMFTRGDQLIGQSAAAIDAPGLPVAEHSLAQVEGFVSSNELANAATMGALFAQANTVDARAVGRLELRPAPLPPDGSWEAADAPMRRRLRLASGRELWLYADRIDDVSGPGEANRAPLDDVTDEASLASGREDGTIAAGADPLLASKIREGGRVLALPGSPTADWVGETAALKDNQVDIVGDVAPASRAAWQVKIDAAQASGDPAQLVAVRAAMEIDAHPGQTIARNRIPGSAKDNPHIELATGRPLSVHRQADGRYAVVMADLVTGEPQAAVLYDQIIYAYGQSKASYLEELLGPPPVGGILEPVYADPEKTQYVGLRVPSTGYMLRGSAAANGGAAPWVKESARAAWSNDLRKASAGTEMFDGRRLSANSDRVSDGIELSRDRIQRGNAAEARTNYRLPGDEVELELGRDRAAWPAKVRRFMIDQVPAAPPDKIQVVERGDAMFEISVDGQPLGMWKVFQDDGAARSERAMLKLLNESNLQSIRTVRERGAMSITEGGTDGGTAVLTDKAPGQTIEELALSLPSDPRQRRAAFEQLEAAMVRASVGLAEIHATFADASASAADRRASRKVDADRLLAKLREPATVTALGGPIQAAEIEGMIRGQLYEPFLAADLPATAALGDAQISNFKVASWVQQRGTFRDLYATSVGSMERSLSARQGDGAESVLGGAAGSDIARLLGSLDSLPESALSSIETTQLREKTLDAYRDAMTATHRVGIDPVALSTTELWYRVAMETENAPSNENAATRIKTLVQRSSSQELQETADDIDRGPRQ